MDHRNELELFSEHYDRTFEEMEKYVASKPYSFAIGYDAIRREQAIRLTITRPAPHRLRSSIGAALGSLRNSLEYLAHAVVEANGPPKKPSRIQFPIFDTPDAFVQQALGKNGYVAEATVEAQAAFEGLQPYHGNHAARHHALWALHELSRKHRHRRPIALGVLVRDVKLFVTASPIPVRTIVIPNGTFDHGVIVARAQLGLAPGEFPPRNMKAQMEMEGIMAVAFSANGAGGGRPVHDMPQIHDYIRDFVFPVLEKHL